MTMLTRRRVFVSAFAALFASSFAVAQAPQTVRVRGTIEKVDGQTLTVKLRDGNTLTIKPADNARFTAMVKASLAGVGKRGQVLNRAAASRCALPSLKRSPYDPPAGRSVYFLAFL